MHLCVTAWHPQLYSSLGTVPVVSMLYNLYLCMVYAMDSALDDVLCIAWMVRAMQLLDPTTASDITRL